MSTRHKKNQELNLLSAYLDHALREPEQNRLETRLAQEPELQKRLENLRRTKQLIGFLQHLKAPRNFTLTPQMVTVRKPRQPLFTTLRLATAIASILLVVLLSLEGIAGLPKASMVEAPLAMEESARAFDTETTPEPLIIWGGQEAASVGMGGGMGGGIGGGGGGEADSFITEELTLEVDPEAVLEETVVAPAEEPVKATAVAEIPPETPEETVEADRASIKAPDEELILGLNTDEAGQIIKSSIPAETNAEKPALQISPIRWVEIGLAVIALGGGIGLLIHRKRT